MIKLATVPYDDNAYVKIPLNNKHVAFNKNFITCTQNKTKQKTCIIIIFFCFLKLSWRHSENSNYFGIFNIEERHFVKWRYLNLTWMAQVNSNVIQLLANNC